jgi:hypothetical protein
MRSIPIGLPGRRYGTLPALALALLLAVASPAHSSPACEGDCDGDGTVLVSEVLTLVNIALGLLPASACQERDPGRAVTIDVLVRAVASGLNGCPPVSPSPSETETAAASPAATSTPAQGNTPTPTSPAETATATAGAPTTVASPGASVTATETAPDGRTATASAAPTDAPAESPSPTSTTSVTAAATTATPPTSTVTPFPTATPSATFSSVPTDSPTATFTSSPTPTSTPPPTPTESPTPAPSATPTPGLGTRRFSLAPASSGLRLLPAETTILGFSGHLDLAAGVPDPVSGLTRIDVIGASPFLWLDLDAFTRLCIRPIVPVLAAGVLACNGGFDLGVATLQDHRLGVVGVGGFTAAECEASGGTVEAAPDPHPGVCNGPVIVGGSGESDSGPGALLIAPDSRYDTQGLPAEVSIGSGACETHGSWTPTLFGFVSALSRAEILDVNNEPGESLSHEERGQAFSCESWQDEHAPGRLVLSVPSLHAALGQDLITVFILDGGG